MEKGRVLPLAKAAKEAVKIPILCGGRMTDPDLAAPALAAGSIDGIVLGRPSLADPAYPQKVAMGCPEDIRPCIGCNQGCIGALMIGRRAGCAVNPQAAREASFDLTPAAIIRTLDLRKPIYRKLAAYGHMGREDLGVKWENTDRVDELKAAVAAL